MKLSDKDKQTTQSKNQSSLQQKQTNRKQPPPSNNLTDIIIISKSDKYFARQLKISQSLLSYSAWDIEIKMNKCLSQTEKTQVFKAISVRFKTDLVLKIILIYKDHLSTYIKNLGQAEIYYQRNKKTADFIIPNNKISAIINSNNVPTFRNSSQQQIHLEFIRPYFSGRNFHQQVYVHSRFPFQFDQFSLFIKYALDMLNTDTHEPTFIPTLDNIYFDGISMIGNLTSFETYMFLRHFNHHLSTENFKHLYILLPSDPTVFCQWQKMQKYLVEKIKVKAFFTMLFCFITIRSPIQMIFGEKINQQDLQWARIIDPVTKKINQSNKIIILIREIRNRWQNYLNKPENKKCLEMASLKIYFQLKNRDQTLEANFYEIEDFEYSDKQKNFLYDLFMKIFVKEEKFGWQDFIAVKDRSYEPEAGSTLRQFVIQDAKQLKTVQLEKEEYQRRINREQKERRTIGNQKYEIDTDEDRKSQTSQQQILKQEIKKKIQVTKAPREKTDKRQYKLSALKASFIYLHKYFVVQDIKQRKLSQQQAKAYVKSLNFQMYVPLKIGLSLTITLDYQEWFEVFFIETGDERPDVYDAANVLYKLISTKSLQILTSVKGCELIHLKRIEFIVEQKLYHNKNKSNTFMIHDTLQKQITYFVQQNRPYEEALRSLGRAIQCSGGSNDKQSIKKTVQDPEYYFEKGNVYQDIQPLIKSIADILDAQNKWNTTNGSEKNKYKKIIQSHMTKSPGVDFNKILNSLRGKFQIEKQSQKPKNA